MAKSPDKPKKDAPRKDPARPTRARASKPEVSPLAPHLAQLLNPALAPGFEDMRQASYDASDPTALEDEGVPKWVLGELPPQGGGVQATADSLAELLRLGDPHLRDTNPWVPHRPERPPNSELISS
ncbi:MAG: excinuclease ABC subunit UvrB, partial [Chloroflexota bacterium]